MDALQRAFYRTRFREVFLERKGKAFEDWFARLAEFALGPDFERVRPYGAEGDWKADARTRSDHTIYQCYAPETLSRDKLNAKMTADFGGAVQRWHGWIQRWVFVHNDIRGLAAAVYAQQDLLRARHRAITIEVWGEAALTKLADRMDLAGWESLFGVVASQRDSGAVAPADIEEAVRDLEQLEPTPGEEPIHAPSVDKIAKNELSEYVVQLLNAGKPKDQLVKRFFDNHHRPDHGEKVAEAFRARYRSLRNAQESPDDIFHGLQRYIGTGGSPKRQIATLAVLSYLFDRCDIFEDPESAQ
ncbi:MAG: hypothetical protein OXH05_12485 [Acidobacteria bacterium]|nr:hypothetical protein [Acidobacteriota bacterium]